MLREDVRFGDMGSVGPGFDPRKVDEQQTQPSNQSVETTNLVLIDQIIKALQEENQDLRSRIYNLEIIANRFTSVLESLFKDELERRVSSKDNHNGCAQMWYSTLDRLSDQIQKEKQYNANR